MKIGTVLFAFVMAIALGVCITALYVLLNPKIANKSGPPWLWRWGVLDPVRNLFFQGDGSLRAGSMYILVPLAVLVAVGAAFFLVAILIG
jgi:hypothetical protein